MLYNIYQFAHDIGLHFWDIFSILALIISLLIAGVHTFNQRKREREFEEKHGGKTEEETTGTVYKM